MKITTKELTPELWPDFEALFGANGACGGCWCMSWRVERGEKWSEMKGAIAKKRMKALIAAGRSLGILAFAEGEPIGWCSFGPRRDYAKLHRAPSFQCDDADQVWSIPCFFVRKGFRGQGVASVLIQAAVAAMKRRGASIIEGYPVKAQKAGATIPHAFAWTGTQALFENAGFQLVGDPARAKLRVRLGGSDGGGSSCPRALNKTRTRR